MRFLRVLTLMAALVPMVALTAQKPATPRRCQLDVLSVDREGYYEDFQAGVNYFAGGNVRMRCRNQPVFLDGDSLASYNQEVIWLITRAHYRDESIDLRADTLIYRKADERLQMRGNVVGQNLANGSTLKGPWVDYLRGVPGIRDSAEVIAQQRPILTYRVARAVADTTDPLPYTVTADVLQSRGSSWSQGWGNVEVERGGLHGRGDSLLYVSGMDELMTLIGAPASLTNMEEDSLLVSGKRVRLGLEGEALRRVDAFGGGTVRRGDLLVDADSTILDFAAGELSFLRAWDDTRPAKVLASGFDVRGDSIAIATPGERLKELEVFRHGAIVQPLDSVLPASPSDSTTSDSLPPIRNTMTGMHIVGSFVDHDSAGVLVSRLSRILATGNATALFSRTVQREGTPSPTINYTRGDTIVVEMQVGDSSKVREVRAYRGSLPVDGIQLERATLRELSRARPEPEQGRVQEGRP